MGGGVIRLVSGGREVMLGYRVTIIVMTFRLFSHASLLIIS